MGDNKKIKSIEYLDGFTVDEEGFMYPVRGSERVVMNNVRRYYNCLYMLVGLKLCARNLMDWLTEEMNEDNIVYNTAWTRGAFIHFVAEISNEEVNYADQTVKAAFSELSKSGLLIAKSKGAYRVHPKYFFKGSESDRLELIMLEIKLSSTNTNFKVLPYKK